jgi:hypothetical protein
MNPHVREAGSRDGGCLVRERQRENEASASNQTYRLRCEQCAQAPVVLVQRSSERAQVAPAQVALEFTPNFADLGVGGVPGARSGGSSRDQTPFVVAQHQPTMWSISRSRAGARIPPDHTIRRSKQRDEAAIGRGTRNRVPTRQRKSQKGLLECGGPEAI